MRISIIGAGSWGTAMAAHLSLLGHEVQIWAREPEVAEGISNDRRNPLYLRDVLLPDRIRSSDDIASALKAAEVVVMAVPSRWVRGVAADMKDYLAPDIPVLNLAKGFDYGTGKRLSVTIAEELEGMDNVAVLSGPNHAEEVARKIPSATVIASVHAGLSRELQKVFTSSYLRVYTNRDIIGVEVGGAYKNIIAIAAGVLDGLGLGDNTKASLITRGLAEMARFGSALGANPVTFSGLSGIGDLIVTCISLHSRNRGFGERLGRGGAPESILSETNMVVEGVYATRVVASVSAGLGVDLPIAASVDEIIERNAKPTDFIDRLMTRNLKEEAEESLYRDFLVKSGMSLKREEGSEASE